MRKMEDIKLGTDEWTVKQQTCNFPESLDNLNRLSLASLFHSFYLLKGIAYRVKGLQATQLRGDTY